MMDIKEILFIWFKIFLTKSLLLVVVIKKKICETKNSLKNYIKQLLQNLRNKSTLSFIDKLWGADLADVQLICKFNKGIRFFILCY